MKDPRDVLIRPVWTEKSLNLAASGTYSFIVHPSANKIEIRQAVEAAFDVKVVKVNTLNRKGKQKRNRRKNVLTKRPDAKRAIVTLKEGDKIELFES